MAQSKFHYNPESVKEINEATFELNEQTDFMVKDKLGPEDKAVRWRVPINSTRNYFECEIISKGEAGSGIWIGLGEYPAYQDEFYFYENIVSFQVENGHIHRGDACRVQLQDCTDYALKLNLTYAEGDRIGCGIDFDFDQCHSNYVDVFFTKNGMQIGDLIRCKKYFFCNTMCPVVGMREVGEKIRFLKHCYQPSLLSAVTRSDMGLMKMLVGSNPLPCDHEFVNSNRTLAFQEACRLGLAEVVRTFLTEYSGNDLLSEANADENALQIAVKNRRSNIVQILLGRDGSEKAYEEEDEDGCMPLLVAAKNGDKESFTYLLQHAIQIKATKDKKEDHTHSESRLHDIVLSVEEEDSQPVNQDSVEDDSREQDSPLARVNQELKELKNKHPHLLKDSKESKNVLHLAAENGHEKIIKVLWSEISSYSMEVFVALMTRTDKDGNTPLHLCCKNGHTAVVREFLAILKVHGVLENANRYFEGDITYCNVLNNIDDDDDDGYQCSALHLACLHGHKDVFELLSADSEFKQGSTYEHRQTPLHFAAAGGHVDIIKMLLHGQADIFARDGNFDTPLHLAAKCGRVEAVKYLMQIADELQTKARAEKLKTLRKRKRKSADGDHETDDHDLFRRRKTYLDRAILNGQREVVDAVVNNPTLELDHMTYSEDTLSLLIKRMPDAARSVLDDCIESKSWRADYSKEKCEVTLNYDKLQCRLGQDNSNSKRIRSSNGWKKFLESLKDCEEEDLIRHPIVEGYIHNAWNQNYWWIFYLFLGLHVMFVALLTCFILLLNNPTSPICESILSGQSNNLTVLSEVNTTLIPDRYSNDVAEFFMRENVTVVDGLANISRNGLCSNAAAPIMEILATFTSLEISCSDCGIRSGVTVFIRVLAVILIIVSVVKLFSEFAQFLHGLSRPCRGSDANRRYWWLYFSYFSDLSNWMELPLYILTIIFASAQFNSKCTCVHSRLWSIGIASLFLAWASLILFLRKLELFDTGIYVLILEILFKRFLKTIILTSFLVVMFAITFYLTFNQIDPSFARSPFSSVYKSLWKMMTMVTGEMDYESIFRQSSSATLDSDPPLPFPEISYVLWIIFLIMIPILLNNMLVGLAVDDIKDILNTAEVEKLKSKIDLIVTLNKLMSIWAAIILVPVIFLLACIFCPCISITIYNGQKARSKGKFGEILENIVDRSSSLWHCVLKDREPKICTKKIHPFKIRSPLSSSKHYKSPENLNKIIEKPSYEEKIPAVPKVAESCLKEEMKVCLRQELQQYLFGIEEMNSRFKQILEDNVKKMEEMISLRMSQDKEPRVTNSHTDRETAV